MILALTGKADFFALVMALDLIWLGAFIAVFPHRRTLKFPHTDI